MPTPPIHSLARPLTVLVRSRPLRRALGPGLGAVALLASLASTTLHADPLGSAHVPTTKELKNSHAATADGSAMASKAGGFNLERLPLGKDITMPRPATTFVPISARVILTATDMPQTISFVPINLAHGPSARLRLAIFDQNSDRVQYIEVSPGTPFLYPLKDLSSVTVIPSTHGRPDTGLFLQVESDKPLQVAH